MQRVTTRPSHVFLPAITLNLLLAGALLGLSGCGRKGGSGGGEDSIKGPATAAQAARVLDLSTFPLMDGAKPPWPRGVASLNYPVSSDVKTAFEFQRKKLIAQGWKELPNTSVTAQSAAGTFARNGFILSLAVIPNEPGSVRISLQNHGNIRPSKLPAPSGVKGVYVGDMSAMYVTDAPVAATAEAVRKLLLGQGWIPYGAAGDSAYYKQNAIRVTATVSSAPAQGGKTMISYLSELLSADLPAPPDAEDLRYIDQSEELSFKTAANQDAVVDFYRKTLATSGWQSTLDKTVEISDKPTMIFRNPAKDMLTLSFARAADEKTRVSLQFQSAAEIAELDRQLKEQAPKIRAAAQAKQAEEDARAAEANKPLPKIGVTLPGDAKGVEQTTGELKFTVGNGQARTAVESLRKQFVEAGWKQDVATLEPMAGAISVSKDKQSVSISYTDTGVLPAEVNLSSMGGEIEIKK